MILECKTVGKLLEASRHAVKLLENCWKNLGTVVSEASGLQTPRGQDFSNRFHSVPIGFQQFPNSFHSVRIGSTAGEEERGGVGKESEGESEQEEEERG